MTTSISTQDARGIFTKAVADVYRERPVATSFLASFFRKQEFETLEVSIEVQRGTEKVAVDVLRGTEGKMNVFNKSSEKIFIPPYYRESFPMTDLDFYDKLFGDSDSRVEVPVFSRWLETATEKIDILRDKIERAIEKQCAQVFTTGIIELQANTNIDFKRKAASKVDLGAGNYWNEANTNPFDDLEAGCIFIRTKGKAQGGVFNAILGSSALSVLLNNTTVKQRADIKRMSLDTISPPQANALGGVYHGTITCGSFEVNLWTYPEYYDDASNSVSYIDEKDVILLPLVPRFSLSYGAVPMIKRNPGNTEYPEFISPARGAYHVGNYLDAKGEKHVLDVKSAPIAIPTAVDQIYTVQVIA